MPKAPTRKRNTGQKPRAPKVIVLAGPNGAGKSTLAGQLLRGRFRVREFVNADDIAVPLSGDLTTVAIAAGRQMLRRIHKLASDRANFAFETTLASRSFAPWIKDLVNSGYEFSLMFLWLPSPEFAFRRVQERVQRGGHSVAEATVRRRYYAGLRNFFRLYQPLAFTWQMIDNSKEASRVIATGTRRRASIVEDPGLWRSIKQSNRK